MSFKAYSTRLVVAFALLCEVRSYLGFVRRRKGKPAWRFTRFTNNVGWHTNRASRRPEKHSFALNLYVDEDTPVTPKTTDSFLKKKETAIVGNNQTASKPTAAHTRSDPADDAGVATENQSNSRNSRAKKEGVKMPWWWHVFWWVGRKLRITKKGKPGQDIVLGDTSYVARTNVEQIYGGGPSLDGCPIATGAIDDIGDGTRFIGLLNYTDKYGSPYKLCFGPVRSFLVFSDPVQIKHLLKDAHEKYDKGVLAEILKPIMGNGLMPVSDPKVWSDRRRAIVPAFHKAWIQYMVGLFGYSTRPLLTSLDQKISASSATEDGSSFCSCEMESLFCSVALDIMGKSLFNYDFGSVTSESPFIKAVCSALMESEHRAQTLAPYWKLPLANRLVPRLRRFNRNLRTIHKVMDDLVARAKQTRTVTDLEELEKRNYDQVQDPSMLRFMVDMRGANIDDQQLRDDFITMLVSGHETVAAVLTWSLFELVKHPKLMKRAQEEIDSVLGDDPNALPTYDDIKEMEFVRLVVAETLRLYPEPPLLIRRCRTADKVPKGGGAREATVIRGMDVFMATHSLHRDERYWKEPNRFDPDRFTVPYSNPDVPEWQGFDPEKWRGKQLYPNEVASDYAFIPFGGGARRCVGDEFAMLEIIVTLTMLLKRFEFDFDRTRHTTSAFCDVHEPPQRFDHPVGMHTGATIHTRHGLHMLVKRRENNEI
eukprot:CAMPEP_0194036482 /NCGR_PEP_ID=MMETSP0009_2-20130614/8828_1 /TAXON_ID=210454 /ORGANISM="Grammatophora oceanica, Strain CCMP 410" /LENGTH=707 /DNA_ID=CAMNT_0038678249 /DNA_START=54 /DNA_END=2177 /DNA_ORIENTATION=-